MNVDVEITIIPNKSIGENVTNNRKVLENQSKSTNEIQVQEDKMHSYTSELNSNIPDESPDYGKLIRNAVKIARRNRNPRGIRIHPVTGYSNLVPQEVQQQAMSAYCSRYAESNVSPSSKRNHPSESKIQDNQSPQAVKRVCKMGAIISLLLVTLFISPGYARRHSEPVEITPFKTHPGLYFEEMGHVRIINSEWNIISYYDLTSYWQELKGLQSCIAQLSELCNVTKLRKYYCEEILTQFQHQVQQFEEANNLLHQRGGNHKSLSRKKRAPLNIVGNIANSLFGILDSEYATYIDGEINKARDNEEHLLKLIRNQTSIIEATLNIFKKNEDQIQTQFKIISDNLKALSLQVKDTEATQLFNSLSIHTNLVFHNYGRMQGAIIDTLIDIQHGKINPLLLTVSQLQEQISLIKNNLPATLALPKSRGNSELLLYNLMTARARVLESRIIFNIKIPLIHAEKYQLFKLVPVPTLHEDKYIFIQPSTENLIVSLHRDQYYPISQLELDKCINFEQDEYLCKQSHPIYNLKSNVSRCEIMLLNHKKPMSSDCQIHFINPTKLWIQLHSPNSWLYVLDQEYTFNIVCDGKVTSKTLQGDGILTLREDCILREESMTISGHHLYETNLNASFIPFMNLSSETREIVENKKISYSTNHLFLTKERNSIEKQLADMKKQEELPAKLNSHDIHHYTSIYIMIFFITALSTYFGYIRYCKRSKKIIISHPVPAPRTNLREKSNSLTAEDFVLPCNTEGENVRT